MTQVSAAGELCVELLGRCQTADGRQTATAALLVARRQLTACTRSSWGRRQASSWRPPASGCTTPGAHPLLPACSAGQVTVTAALHAGHGQRVARGPRPHSGSKCVAEGRGAAADTLTWASRGAPTPRRAPPVLLPLMPGLTHLASCCLVLQADLMWPADAAALPAPWIGDADARGLPAQQQLACTAGAADPAGCRCGAPLTAVAAQVCHRVPRPGRGRGGRHRQPAAALHDPVR